jgi:hypothetical protein
MESSITLMKMVSKYVFHGSELNEKKIFDETINILHLTMLETGKSMEHIMDCNMIKLNMRYPNGRSMEYVTKNVSDENLAIKKHLENNEKN